MDKRTINVQGSESSSNVQEIPKSKIASLPGYDDSGENEFIHLGREDLAQNLDDDELNRNEILMTRLENQKEKLLESVRLNTVNTVVENQIPSKEFVSQEIRKKYVKVSNPVRIHGNYGLINERLAFLKNEILILEEELKFEKEKNTTNELSPTQSEVKQDSNLVLKTNQISELEKTIYELGERTKRIESFGAQLSLSNQLNELRSNLKNVLNTTENITISENDSSKPQYQNTNIPNFNELSDSFLLQNFDNRLKSIENIIFSHSVIKSSEIPNIEDSLNHIESKLKLLNIEELKAIQNHIQSIGHSLQQYNDTPLIQSQKINYLYQKIQYWNSFSENIPTIIERLYQLRHIHDQEVDFINSFRELKEKAQTLEQVFSNQQDLLNIVSNNFEKNIEIFENNIMLLDKKLEQIVGLQEKSENI